MNPDVFAIRHKCQNHPCGGFCIYGVRSQLPWPLALPALLDHVCDKIFDIELSFAFAWHLLEQAEQEPMAYIQQFQPATEMLAEQYHERIRELAPEIGLHLNELEKFRLTADGACS